jgi:hypothetical protein
MMHNQIDEYVLLWMRIKRRVVASLDMRTEEHVFHLCTLIKLGSRNEYE